jgi:preprotein translocase subunit SecY
MRPKAAQLFGYSLQAKLPARAPVCRGRRMACTLYALLAYRIGSYILVPGIDPAAFERVMALEDRSVLS